VHEYTVYFSADDGTNGDELWAHNSINETTWLVIDLHPSGGSVGDIQEYNGHLYFSADDGTDGLELWKLIFSKDVTYV
jgi:ELWxxDGT repeat protein